VPGGKGAAMKKRLLRTEPLPLPVNYEKLYADAQETISQLTEENEYLARQIEAQQRRVNNLLERYEAQGQKLHVFEESKNIVYLQFEVEVLRLKAAKRLIAELTDELVETKLTNLFCEIQDEEQAEADESEDD
jgi:predicted RNase H-like nuclease (RuvC/YqgF family)